MKNFIYDQIAQVNLEEAKSLFEEKTISEGTILLHEGEVAEYVYFVNQGCLRLWNNDDGKEITLQFFFENDMVSSFESFYNNQPSIFTIECIEKTQLTQISKYNLRRLVNQYPEINVFLTQAICQRFIDYTRFFLSRIKNSPQKRYEELIKENPKIISRVPHHYVASYLGITPVSLSRIRKRIKKE